MLAEVSGRFSPLYPVSCISLAFHDVSPWSPSLVQMPVVPVKFQEWNTKDFQTIIPTVTPLPGYVSFTMLDNTKRTLNWGLHLSWWHLNKEGFSCIGVWGEDLAKSVSSPSGALAIQEFLSHFIPIALWGIWLFKSQSYWIKKSVPGAAFCHEAKFDLCTAQFWLEWSPVGVFSKHSALLLIWDCWAV